MRPVLLLEINEVPWRVLDRYLGDPKLPHLTQFFSKSQTYTTHSTDSGELSPWVTWPSFHRGMDNSLHAVKFLGQDPATFKGTPIWEEYRNRGYSIGIGGSLQSWPPQDPGPRGFYIPDTFARDESCIPKWVEPFQKYNLQQTRANGRVVESSSLFSSALSQLLLNLGRLGIRPRTYALVAHQLARELTDLEGIWVARRPIFQTILFWDIFRKLFSAENPPEFSTFFSNHIAGVIHRYWDHVFPEDFESAKRSKNRPHAETLFFAMQFLDLILKESMEFCKKNEDLIIVFATSMGQAARVWKRFQGVAFSIPQIPKLLEACGLAENEFEPLMAMVPQIAVRIQDANRRRLAQQMLDSATVESGANLFKVEEIGDRLSISVVTPVLDDVRRGSFHMRDRSWSWEEAGIQVNEVDNGTGYHIPEGSMAIYGRGIEPTTDRREILATDAKAMILSLSGVG